MLRPSTSPALGRPAGAASVTAKAAAAVALTLLTSICAAQVPRYHLVNLGNIMMATARGIENNNQVYGAYAGQPALWNGHEWNLLPDGHWHGAITAIPDRENIATLSFTGSNDIQIGAVWHGTHKRAERIANPSGGTDVVPTAMNAKQVVVGNANLTAGGPMQRCFRWAAGMSQDLGTFASGDSCTATGIDEQGAIVGNANVVPGGPSHAFVWQDGSFSDLGSFGGDGGTAAAINRLGHVVGAAALPLQEGQTQAATHAYLWTGAGLQDLGTLGGTNSTAVAINASDMVVGYSDTASGSDGFLWSNGTMYTLDSLVDNAEGWQFTGPSAINDEGAIIGLGFYAHFAYAFMLIPE